MPIVGGNAVSGDMSSDLVTANWQGKEEASGRRRNLVQQSPLKGENISNT